MPSKIDSNITALAYAEESSLGVLPVTPVWRDLEPNAYNDMGGDSPTVARSTINASRQRQKGSVVDKDAAASFSHDFLLTGLNRLLRSFFFAAYHEKADTQGYDTTNVAVTAVSGVSATIPVGPVFLATALVLGSGFGVAANNSVHALTAATATTLTGSGFAVEAAPPSTARLQTVGVRGANADITMTYAGGVATLGSTILNFTTLGLSPGEWVYLGDDTLGNRFADNEGFARVKTIAANAIVFDITSWTPVTNLGVGKTISLYFGKFLRNEKDPTLIVQKSVQFERKLGNDGNGTMAEYVVGSVGNELTLNMPQADKLTIDLGFIGIDTEENDGLTGPKAGTRVLAADEEAINTSLDMVRSSLYLLSAASGTTAPQMLFGYLDEASLTISNGVTPNKALGVLGAFDLSAGDFTAGGSVTAYFTSMAAVQAVRNNTSCGMFNIFCRSNGGFVTDLPHLTLGGGRVSVEKDTSIKLPVEASGFESDTYGFTAAYTSFPYLPNRAMPS